MLKVNKLLNNLFIFWSTLRFFEQNEISQLALISKSFYKAIYHPNNPLLRKFSIFTRTSCYEYWLSYFNWVIKIITNIQPMLLEISLTLSRVSDNNMPEPELKAAIMNTMKKLFNSIRGDTELREFKLYIDQHPLRQKVLKGFLNALADNSESLSKVRINQVSLKDKHILILSKLKNLKSIDIGYCVCEKGSPLEDIGGALNEFRCKDASNISANQIIEVLKKNQHIWSLSFCGEEYKAEDMVNIIKNINMIRKLIVSYALTINTDFFEIISKHAKTIERLELYKVPEASSAAISKLVYHSMPLLNVLVLNECEFLDSGCVELIVNNCPNLTLLSLEWSSNVNDKGVNQILENLFKLKELRLTGLKRLTCKPFERALEMKNSAYNTLQQLDLSQCNLIEERVLRAIVKIYPTIIIKNYYGETNECWN